MKRQKIHSLANADIDRMDLECATQPMPDFMPDFENEEIPLSQIPQKLTIDEEKKSEPKGFMNLTGFTDVAICKLVSNNTPTITTTL